MQAPSIADIEKWNTEQLIQHLQAKFPNKLSKAALDILKEQRIRGRAFLRLTEKDLSDGMKRGPASVIAGYVEELKGMLFLSQSIYVCLLTYATSIIACVVTVVHHNALAPMITKRLSFSIYPSIHPSIHSLSPSRNHLQGAKHLENGGWVKKVNTFIKHPDTTITIPLVSCSQGK